MSFSSAINNFASYNEYTIINIPANTIFTAAPLQVSTISTTPVNILCTASSSYTLPLGRWLVQLTTSVCAGSGSAYNSWVSQLYLYWTGNAAIGTQYLQLINNQMVGLPEFLSTFSFLVNSDGTTPLALTMAFGPNATTVPACYGGAANNTNGYCIGGQISSPSGSFTINAIKLL